MSLFIHHPHPHQPQNPNTLHEQEKAKAGFNQRIAIWLTKGFQSIWSFYIFLFCYVVWMLLASLGIWYFRYDPYPFAFLLFCSNLTQLLSLPVLAAGQAVLSRKAELQAEETYHTSVKMASDIAQIIEHLTAQDGEILRISQVLSDPTKTTLH